MKSPMKAILALVALVGLAVAAVSPLQAKVGMGNLFYAGEIVRTVVVPAPIPFGGRDNFYAVMEGAAGQLGVAGSAPGAEGYRGGAWAFHAVIWNVEIEPYLLMSEEDVIAAYEAGEVVVERIEAADFRCPVQP